MKKWQSAILLTFLVFLTLTSCNKIPVFMKGRFKTIDLTNSPQASSVFVPTSLKKTVLQQDNFRFVRKSIPFPFTIYLGEKNESVLGGNSYKIEFPKGGGELDLRHYTTSERPGFYRLGFEAHDVEVSSRYLRVYQISNSKRRKLAGDVVGNGCKMYFDITSYFNSSMTGEGILATTHQNRDVSLLAGTYVFVFDDDVNGKKYISYLTIKNSQYRQLQCKL